MSDFGSSLHFQGTSHTEEQDFTKRPPFPFSASGSAAVGAWVWASFSQYVYRVASAAALGHFPREILRINVPPVARELRALGPVAQRVLQSFSFDGRLPELPANYLLSEFANKIEATINEYILDSLTTVPFGTSQFGAVGTIGFTIRSLKTVFGFYFAVNTSVTQLVKRAFKHIPAPTRLAFYERYNITEIKSVNIYPDYVRVFWDGYWDTLHPEQELRILRLALLQIENDNFEGAARDLAHVLRSHRKYGKILINNTIEV